MILSQLTDKQLVGCQLEPKDNFICDVRIPYSAKIATVKEIYEEDNTVKVLCTFNGGGTAIIHRVILNLFWQIAQDANTN